MKLEQTYKFVIIYLLSTTFFLFLGIYKPSLQYNFVALLFAALLFFLIKKYKHLSAKYPTATPTLIFLLTLQTSMIITRSDVALTFVIVVVILLIADRYYPFL